MKLTAKQHQIMDVAMKGNQTERGVTISWCDIQQIRDRLPYKASREAVICSLRFLEKKGLLEIRSRSEVRGGRRRTLYVPTNLAFDALTRPAEDMANLAAMLEDYDPKGDFDDLGS